MLMQTLCKKGMKMKKAVNTLNLYLPFLTFHDGTCCAGCNLTQFTFATSSSISDNFSYKCFQYLGIQSQTRHKIHYKPRKVKDKYPNLIYSTWDTVDRPRQVIVSDMTVIKYSWFFFELTMYFDVFTKEILTWHVAERRGHRDQYIDGLNDVINLLKGTDEPTVLHTDQGSVYASLAYNELIKDTLIVRSMSRAGKPTDNPVNESLNGWIKEELFIDFKIETCNSREEFEEALDAYVDYYNEKNKE